MQKPPLLGRKSMLNTLYRFLQRYAHVQRWIFDITATMIIPVAWFYFINSMGTIDHSNWISGAIMKSIIKYLLVVFYLIYLALAIGAIGRKQWGWLFLLIIGCTGIQVFFFFVLYYFVSYRNFLTNIIPSIPSQNLSS
ncbi:MAG: hypothetical protein WCG83_05160 [Candidatus Peregrinibacteria bacterium]